MLGSIIVGAVNVVGTLVAAFLMDRAGRRQLLLVSHVIMTACLAGLAISTWLPCEHHAHSLPHILAHMAQLTVSSVIGCVVQLPSKILGICLPSADPSCSANGDLTSVSGTEPL